jgi:co-chaperonin GroES (HSP10)
MRMLRDNVLVQEIDTNEKQTAGGIILTTPQDNKGSAPAFVIAVGPDVTQVKPCDQVYLDWSQGTAVEVEGKQAVSVAEQYIKAVIES